MSGNRDDVVSGYVRMKIREWRASGREMQDLARVAGFAKSTPSQVMLGTGVGAKTGPRFAKAFGLESYDALKMAAFEWWKGQAEAAAEPQPAAMTEAVGMVVGLGQGTPEQVDTILTAYRHPRFLDRDRDWWLQTLLAELRLDRTAVKEDQADRAAISAGQKVIREANQRRSAPPPRPAKAHKRQLTG